MAVSAPCLPERVVKIHAQIQANTRTNTWNNPPRKYSVTIIFAVGEYLATIAIVTKSFEQNWHLFDINRSNMLILKDKYDSALVLFSFAEESSINKRYSSNASQRKGNKMQLSVKHEVRFGLTYYSVNLNGQMIHSFMSKEHAITCFVRLSQKLGLTQTKGF
jgi:hypothetical protein